MIPTSLITFLVDDCKFTLSRRTFQLYPDSLLTKIVNHKVIDKTVTCDIVKKNIFYVDRDPESFKYIVDTIRGYDIGNPNNIENKNLCKKVIHDLEYFGLIRKEENEEIDDILKPTGNN